MIDGLTLGGTTPGPLIIVVAFVGFLGGWAKQVLGPEAPFFAYHVLWPQGFGRHFDATAAALTAAATPALFRFEVGVMPLLAACALAGLLIGLGR
jgi:hypothetical protein